MDKGQALIVIHVTDGKNKKQQENAFLLLIFQLFPFM